MFYFTRTPQASVLTFHNLLYFLIVAAYFKKFFWRTSSHVRQTFCVHWENQWCFKCVTCLFLINTFLSITTLPLLQRDSDTKKTCQVVVIKACLLALSKPSNTFLSTAVYKQRVDLLAYNLPQNKCITMYRREISHNDAS